MPVLWAGKDTSFTGVKYAHECICMAGLVSYASSDDEEEEEDGISPEVVSPEVPLLSAFVCLRAPALTWLPR